MKRTRSRLDVTPDFSSAPRAPSGPTYGDSGCSPGGWPLHSCFRLGACSRPGPKDPDIPSDTHRRRRSGSGGYDIPLSVHVEVISPIENKILVRNPFVVFLLKIVRTIPNLGDPL